VTPTKDNPVVIARAPRDADEDAEPARELRAFRWGLLPFWAKDAKVGAKILCTSQVVMMIVGSAKSVGVKRHPHHGSGAGVADGDAPLLSRVDLRAGY
jgi:hypothetical protein